MILGIDTGKRKIGYAIVNSSGTLVECGTYLTMGLHPSEILQLLSRLSYDNIIIEEPVLYTGFAVAHDDVSYLRDMVKYVRERHPAAFRVRPSQWKGNVPKKIHTRRILGLLNPGETEVFRSAPNSDHNTIDAIGIAKHGHAVILSKNKLEALCAQQKPRPS